MTVNRQTFSIERCVQYRRIIPDCHRYTNDIERRSDRLYRCFRFTDYSGENISNVEYCPGGGTKSFSGTTYIAVALNVNGGTLNLAGDSLKLTNSLNPIAVANGATMQTGGTPIYTLQKVTLGLPAPSNIAAVLKQYCLPQELPVALTAT